MGSDRGRQLLDTLERSNDRIGQRGQRCQAERELSPALEIADDHMVEERVRLRLRLLRFSLWVFHCVSGFANNRGCGHCVRSFFRVTRDQPQQRSSVS